MAHVIVGTQGRITILTTPEDNSRQTLLRKLHRAQGPRKRKLLSCLGLMVWVYVSTLSRKPGTTILSRAYGFGFTCPLYGKMENPTEKKMDTGAVYGCLGVG